MKILVAYYSQYGNTKKIAEEIAESLKAKGDVNLLSTGQLDASEFEGIDLLVFGVPTHGFGIPQVVKDWFKTIPAGLIQGVPVATFDTSMDMFILRFFTGAPPLARRLQGLDGSPVLAKQTFWVTGGEGPLKDGETDHARQWAETIT